MILKHFFHYIYLLVQHLELGYFMRTVILFPWPYSHIASNRTLSSLTHSGTAAAAAMSLQTCPTLCDPIDGSPPGSLSLGFSRQEHLSGLPFPSPMHKCEKSESEVTQSCPTLSDPMDCSLPGSSVHGIFQARVLEWVAVAFSTINKQTNKHV